MANANKVILLGRLTNAPESRSFGDGGKVTKFGFAVNERRKDKHGEYCDYPMYIDVEVFNRGTFKLADWCEESLGKGSQCFIAGKLGFDQWTDNYGTKKSRHKVVAEDVQFLDRKEKAVAPEPATTTQGIDEILF